jgi:dipeptidyl aminopeptidase/acylaminoacyl peptidase
MVRRLRTPVLLFPGIVIAFSAARAQEPVFTFEDMLGVRTFASGQPIAVSPTGNWLAYVATDLDDEWNVLEPRPTGHLMVQPLRGGGSTRALTEGAVRGSYPVWSPDGKRLAYYREDASGGQLAVWDADSGELSLIGDAFTGRSYLAPRWEPEGRRLAFAAAIRAAAPGPPQRVRVVESTDARIPGDDFFVDRRTATLLVADFGSGSVVPIVSEPLLLRSLRLTSDGSGILYSIPKPETFGVIGKEAYEAFRVSWSGGAPERLSREDAGPDERIWSPDRRQYLRLVADPSIQDPEIEAPQPDMYTIARPFMDLYLGSETGGEERNLTHGFPDTVSDPIWSRNGREIFFKTTHNQSYDEAIRRYSLEDGRLTILAGGAESFDDLNASDGSLVFSAQSATSAPDVHLVDLETGERRRVTDLNPDLGRFRFGRPEMFSFRNADGESLNALLYRPVGAAADGKTPVITWIYEKLTPGIHRFNARHQVFLNHGYALLLPNVKVRVGATATSFVKAVVPAVNKAREMGFEESRFGLWGHSFGAYATSYVITQTDIFACAVSGATPPELFRNWASGRDRDSRNIERGQARMGGSPFEFPERYLSQSGFFHLDKVRTPVLILHGEKDLTILFGEGEMMFYALRQLGKEATFVAYAEGDHSLSRHSRADTLDVNGRILEWFEKHLKSEAKKESSP